MNTEGQKKIQSLEQESYYHRKAREEQKAIDEAVEAAMNLVRKLKNTTAK